MTLPEFAPYVVSSISLGSALYFGLKSAKKADFDALRGTVGDLRDEISRQRAEIQELESKVRTLENINGALENENKRLYNENVTLIRRIVKSEGGV